MFTLLFGFDILPNLPVESGPYRQVLMDPPQRPKLLRGSHASNESA